MTHHIDLDTMTLDHGSHRYRDDGVCLLEAVAWWAGEDHTDHPACVSPVLGSFGRRLNDILPDGRLQQLVPFIPLLAGTAGDGKDEQRGYLALDWLLRTYTPAWLDLAGLTAEASALRDFRRVADLAAAQAIRAQVQAARDKASAAWAAAVVASGDAAWAAAGDASGAAAWAAAWAASVDASGAAAGAASVAAAGDTAWAASVAAAWAAAGAASGDASGDAARATARATLKPTAELLQDSAISLFSRMVRCDEN